MENKTIDPQEYYTKLKEIDAKIRIAINDMVNQYSVEIDSSRNEVINVVNVNVYIDRLEENYEDAKMYFAEKMLRDFSIWGYLAERILGSTRDSEGNRKNYTLVFEDEIVSYNFYFKESD